MEGRRKTSSKQTEDLVATSIRRNRSDKSPNKPYTKITSLKDNPVRISLLRNHEQVPEPSPSFQNPVPNTEALNEIDVSVIAQP